MSETVGRDRRLARILAPIGVVLLAPAFVLYGLWIAGGRLADRYGQRRRRL